MPDGLAFLLFLGKPIWYSLILAAASKYLPPFGPHWPPPGAEDASPDAMKTRERLTFAAGGVVRAALGWTFLLTGNFIQSMRATDTAFLLLLGAYGFLLWCLVGKAVFRRAPLGRVLAFAALAEMVSLCIDIPAVFAVDNIRIC